MSEPKLVIQRHNGQCGYGEWYREQDGAIPSHVYEAVMDENCENWLALDHGEIVVGGQRYEWKLVEEAE